MRKFFLLFFTSVILLSPLAVVHAGNFLTDATKKLDNSVGGIGFEKNLEVSISTIVTAALSVVGTIFFVLTIYAGILWMTAAGEEERAGKARKIITASVIGLIIVMGAYAITYFVTNSLGSGSGAPTDVGACLITNTHNGSRACNEGSTRAECDRLNFSEQTTEFQINDICATYPGYVR